MAPRNVLLVLSDEHRPDALGRVGHPHVETPTIDRLAREGTRFSSAYCSSPLCAPSRASFATGRYVHEIGNWDNATPYDGHPRSWGHHFAEHGVDVTTIGKLDFEPGVDDGFPDQRAADHRDEPDVNGLHRDPPIVRENARDRIQAAGPTDSNGEGWYVERENRVTREAIDFLEARADERAGAAGGTDTVEEPWVLWTNYILPHFPLEAEPRYYGRYIDETVELPTDYPPADDHPVLDELRAHFDGLDLDEVTLRRTRAAYYGLCTALDDHLERLLAALDRLGLAEDTLVVYASDHGEPLGDHGLWWKCCLYESAVGVPLVLRGPDIESDRVHDAPVSLLDLVPTMADAVGIDSDPAWRGQSLLPVARGESEPDPDRVVFSEYHAHGTSRGMFMLREGRYKYIYYPDNPAQLFDLYTDPEEFENLATNLEYQAVRDHLDAQLRGIVDPEAVDQRARADQRERLTELSSSPP